MEALNQVSARASPQTDERCVEKLSCHALPRPAAESGSRPRHLAPKVHQDNSPGQRPGDRWVDCPAKECRGNIAKPFRLPHSSLDLPRALPWAVIFLPFQGDWPDLTHNYGLQILVKLAGPGSHQDRKRGWLPPPQDPGFERTQSPGKSVARPVTGPTNPKPVSHILKSLPGQEVLGIEMIGSGSETAAEVLLSFTNHLPTTLRLPVDRGIEDYQLPGWPQGTARLQECLLQIFGVME